MMQHKIKMKVATPVSVNGVETKSTELGEEVYVDHLTAAGLVRDDMAEYVGETPCTFQERIDDGQITANELSPGYGEGPHRDAVALEQKGKSEVEAAKKAGEAKAKEKEKK